MNSRDLAFEAPRERRWVIEWRRLWRLLRVGLHILSGVLQALWLGAGRDPHRPELLVAKQRWCRRLLAILNVDVQVHGPLLGGPVMLVGNHVSWLDIPVIASVRPCYFLSKAEVAGWPVIGWLARSVGTLFIRRGAGESRNKAAEIEARLALGHSILVFPEGTTTDGVGVRRFFPQLFVAAGAAAPVQPVAIRYRDRHGAVDTGLAFIGDDEFHHHLWRVLGRRRIRVRLSFAGPLAGEDPKALAQRARGEIITALQ